MPPRRSRQRFSEYQAERRARLKSGEKQPSGKPDLTLRERSEPRSFWLLFKSFWALLRGHRAAVYFALVTLTIATLLSLLPPAATKLVIENVLGGKPLEPPFSLVLPQPDSPLQLLWWLAIGVLAISFVETGIRLWGRWYATRAVTRVQVAIRRQAFEHAVRLPLHRVYKLKSGGVASILRDDAGSISELIFSMLYNPWRAIVQLVGSLVVLAVIDWRLLLGSLVLLPVQIPSSFPWALRRIQRLPPCLRAAPNSWRR